MQHNHQPTGACLSRGNQVRFKHIRIKAGGFAGEKNGMLNLNARIAPALLLPAVVHCRNGLPASLSFGYFDRPLCSRFTNRVSSLTSAMNSL